ncbi:MAG: UDP-3-O-(3-hydroxymyristoyl)glucosamine N-acyltransferase [Phycisphaerae bacterium]|nr:UDP-3-O-(3-hydroxymyristoyl)glucosamine N-acyltransferase [Phycisphaerae bacterium]
MSSTPTITAAELARRLNGTLHGDGSQVIRRVATLENAGPDALSWIGAPSVLPRLAGSQAGAVLISTACPVPSGRTVIVVSDPDIALCAALAVLAPPTPTVPAGVDPAARVADSAVVAGACIGPHVWVGPDAVVGPGTQLHPGVYIGTGAQLGRECVLWPNVVVREYCRLGDRVIIHANSTIGTDGFGYHQRGGRHVKIPQIGIVVIEDDVEVGSNTCIDRARSGETRIGRGTKIDNLVQVGHNVQIGEDTVMAGQCGLSGSVTIGKQVMLGGKVGVTDHVHIGDRAIVAAASVISGDLAGSASYRGIPAVNATQYARELISIRRLPKMMAQMRDLLARVERLESAADDRTRD